MKREILRQEQKCELMIHLKLVTIRFKIPLKPFTLGNFQKT